MKIKIITIFIYFICLEILGKLEIIINKTSITKLAIKIVFFFCVEVNIENVVEGNKWSKVAASKLCK